MNYEYHQDGYLVFTECRYKIKIGKRAGFVKHTGYECVKLDGKEVKTHRVVWYLHHGTWPKCLDHINGINKDNRLENYQWLCPNCHCQTKTWGNPNSSGKDQRFKEH